MRFIPTRFHGILDYVAGLLFIAAPWLFDFSFMGAATWIMVAAGILILLQTIFTDFEVGLIHKISMQAHLLAEFGLGLLLASSPWLFNFADLVFMPHLVGGIFSVLASVTTHRKPSESYNKRHATQEFRL